MVTGDKTARFAEATELPLLEPPKTLPLAKGIENRNSQLYSPAGTAVPIYGDMTKFLALQPRTSEYLFARGAKPIKDFARAGPWQAGGWGPGCFFTICGGRRSRICVGQGSLSP
jgi:hypothetical protein